MIATDFVIAARSLAQHGKRNAFLATALAVVTALLVLMNGLAAGIRSTMLESASILLSGHVNVGGFYKVTSGMAAPLVLDYERVLAEAKAHVPELVFATARGRGYARAVSDTATMDLILGGIDVDEESDFRRVIRLSAGSFAELNKPGTLLVFEDQAKRLGVQVGDALTLSAPTERGMYNTADVRIAAIGKNIGLLSSFSAFMPNRTLLDLYRLKSGTTGAIHLYLQDPEAAGVVAARLRAVLAEGGWRVMEADPQPYWQKLMQKVPNEDWTGQKLDVTTWEDEMSFVKWLLSAVGALTGLLVSILMVIVIVGITNTMWIAIRERTREIGTLRAIGMQRRRVLWIFVLEAALLGLVGTLSGAALAALIAAGINAASFTVPEAVQMFLMAQRLRLEVQPASALGAVAVIASVTTLAAFYPALRAARLRPITAIHHIG